MSEVEGFAEPDTDYADDTRPAPELAPVQEHILRTWDGVRFVDEPENEVPQPEPEALAEAPEPDVDYLGFELIQKYNEHPVKTSLGCSHCGQFGLIYFINNWTNTRVYKDRRYAFTDLLCLRCGSVRVHALYGRNDIEYYYLGIKDED